MTKSNRQIFVQHLRAMYNFMLRYGLSSEQLLAGTGLGAEDMSRPYSRIFEEQARVFCTNIIEQSGEPGIGLEVGWASSLADMGASGLIQATQKTLGEVIREGRNSRELYVILGDWRDEILADSFVITMVSSEVPTLRRFFIERTIAVMHVHAEELTGERHTPLKLVLDYPRPENYQRYQDIFNCPVYFNQPVCELHYPANILDCAVLHYDPQTQEVLRGLRDNLLGKLSSRGNIVREVALTLRPEDGQFPTLEQVASVLAMSSRTLRRRLREQNTSFNELLNGERQRLAEDFLLDTSLAMQQIAEFSGFSDAQSLSQAFKRWRGMTPTQFRQSAENAVI